MTSGTESVTIRKANMDDLDAIKRLADKHKRELGFVVRGALATSIARQETLVAIAADDSFCGFIQYRHRKDGQTTLYNVVVEPDLRRRGIGGQLVTALLTESGQIGQKAVLLRCPIELPANNFYPTCGFARDHTDQGRHRPLNIWVHTLSPSAVPDP